MRSTKFFVDREGNGTTVILSLSTKSSDFLFIQNLLIIRVGFDGASNWWDITIFVGKDNKFIVALVFTGHQGLSFFFSL